MTSEELASPAEGEPVLTGGSKQDVSSSGGASPFPLSYISSF